MAENKNDFVSNKRLYLDKDGKVVEADDPNRHSLLIRAGGSLPYEEAQKYGLIEGEVEEKQAEEAETEEAVEPEKTRKAKATSKKK